MRVIEVRGIMADAQIEVWLRGPVDGYDAMVMPAVHSLLGSKEEIERLAPRVTQEHAWMRTREAASIGFHIHHLGGSLDRLLTYARGEALSDAQVAELKSERPSNEPPGFHAVVALT